MPYVEAMMQGTPVVATPNPGALQALAAGGGEIVPDDGVADTLVALLTDGDRRRRLSEQGARARRRFGWERSIAAHEAAYARAVDLWRGRRA